MKTLVIVSHPYPEASKAIKSLQEAALSVGDVTVRNLETLYGTDTSKIDVVAEQAACEDVERIVFMYPTHWFNLTPMLKEYLNVVWAFGWAFGPGGEALKGKELLVVTTAGASEHMYSQQGLIESTMEEVLTPMKACALYVGMSYAKPQVFFDSMELSEERVTELKATITERLS